MGVEVLLINIGNDISDLGELFVKSNKDYEILNAENKKRVVGIIDDNTNNVVLVEDSSDDNKFSDSNYQL
jgi:hypothetical protein